MPSSGPETPEHLFANGLKVSYVAAMATSHDSPYRHYLREWREYRGLKQEDLAALTGISPSVISRYETGDRRIHMEAQFRLMAALGIVPPQFFAHPGAPFQVTITGDETPEQRRRLLDTLKVLLASDGEK
jgi:transcriptional regulator with XRE-family HTH domain